MLGSATGLSPHHTVLSHVSSRSDRSNGSDSEEKDGEISKEKLEDTAPYMKSFFGSLGRVDDKAVTQSLDKHCQAVLLPSLGMWEV